MALLKQDLSDFEGRGRIITSTYLQFNAPAVFKELLQLTNVEVRVLNDSVDAFHSKGYVFEHADGKTAIIGSSNLTRSALISNSEWNLRFSAMPDGDIALQVRDAITRLEERSEPLTAQWIENYEAARAEDGSKVLVPEPEQVKLVHEITADLFASKSPNAIARDLNERGVPSALDQHRIAIGQKPRGGRWHGVHIYRALQSSTLLGQIEVSDPILNKRGRPVLKIGKKQYGERYMLRDESGNPIVRAEPVISAETYSKVQKLIEDRSLAVTNPREALSLLTGVLYCGYCGEPAYKLAQYDGRRHRYRCSSLQKRNRKCDNPVATVEYEWINTTFENYLQGLMAGAMRRTRVWSLGRTPLTSRQS